MSPSPGRRLALAGSKLTRSKISKAATQILATAKEPPTRSASETRKRKTSDPHDASVPAKTTKPDIVLPTPAGACAAPEDMLMDDDRLSTASGVLSDTCSGPPAAPRTDAAHEDHGSPPAPKAAAKLDLSTLHAAGKLPTSTRKILLTAKSAAAPLSRINPYRVGKAMDTICGPVDQIEHLKSGALLVTTKTLAQAEQLLLRTPDIAFYDTPTPVVASVAWTNQLSYGKIYAPELQEESLDFLLTILSPHNVVGIRKLLSDPKKSFSSALCPDLSEPVPATHTHYWLLSVQCRPLPP